MNNLTDVDFAHLDSLSDDRGLFEHAEGVVRRLEHGYCTDDNARLLVVASREPDDGVPRRLSRLALAFVLEAQDGTGRSRNRMDHAGRWTDRAGTDDCWGRSLWALGTAAGHHDDPLVSEAAEAGFEMGARQRSRWSRSMAFAALGAAELLALHPGSARARSLLVDAVTTIGPIPSGEWVWPESRLRYANAALAEAMIAAGGALEDGPILDRGLAMLGWLLSHETARGHLSVCGIDGRGARDPDGTGWVVQFDQQPIEAAAMADACWRAYSLTGDPTWVRGVVAAAGWFTGANDSGQLMRNEVSGGGYDGLRHDGVNLNQGAESTLALVSTMQRARVCLAAV